VKRGERALSCTGTKRDRQLHKRASEERSWWEGGLQKGGKGQKTKTYYLIVLDWERGKEKKKKKKKSALKSKT